MFVIPVFLNANGKLPTLIDERIPSGMAEFPIIGLDINSNWKLQIV